jgi:DNA-binding transcriptional ArsR family regulator
VRLRVLLDLSDPLRGGRANVALLAARTGIDPRKLSPHLRKLKDLGLIFSQRAGKEIWYEPAAGRVRYQRRASKTTLTITARAAGMRRHDLDADHAPKAAGAGTRTGCHAGVSRAIGMSAGGPFPRSLPIMS